MFLEKRLLPPAAYPKCTNIYTPKHSSLKAIDAAFLLAHPHSWAAQSQGPKEDLEEQWTQNGVCCIL